MVRLGMYFGHNASVSVLADGELVTHVLRERDGRVRKAVGLDTGTIQSALDGTGLTVADVEARAILSTQDLEILTGPVDGCDLEPGALSGMPVVMNTSLNGPGEPIGERPCEALACYESSGIDLLYRHGVRGARATG